VQHPALAQLTGDHCDVALIVADPRIIGGADGTRTRELTFEINNLKGGMKRLLSLAR
jgi:hypothetical protein